MSPSMAVIAPEAIWGMEIVRCTRPFIKMLRRESACHSIPASLMLASSLGLEPREREARPRRGLRPRGHGRAGTDRTATSRQADGRFVGISWKPALTTLG